MNDNLNLDTMQALAEEYEASHSAFVKAKGIDERLLDQSAADGMHFIAAARSFVPAAIAHIKTLEAQLRRPAPSIGGGGAESKNEGKRFPLGLSKQDLFNSANAIEAAGFGKDASIFRSLIDEVETWQNLEFKAQQDYCRVRKWVDNLREQLAALRAATPVVGDTQQWVSVAERLPEVDKPGHLTTYLCWIQHPHGKGYLSSGWLDFDGLFQQGGQVNDLKPGQFRNSYGYMPHVTHWMPTPTPPVSTPTTSPA